jgi:cytochrome P450
VVTPPILAHNNPNVWPDPLTFKPSRWAERDPEANPFGFFPFSSGPRACIGKNFSLIGTRIIKLDLISIETKVALAILLQKFKLENKQDPLDTVAGITMAPAELKMKITPRS